MEGKHLPYSLLQLSRIKMRLGIEGRRQIYPGEIINNIVIAAIGANL